VCSPNYRPSATGCVPCESNVIWITVGVVLGGSILFVLIVIVIRRVEAKYFLNTLQIVVSYAQVVASTSQNYGETYQWPTVLQTIMSFCRVAMFDVYRGAAINCIIPSFSFYTLYYLFVTILSVAICIFFAIRVFVPLVWQQWYPDLFTQLRKPLRDTCLKGLFLFVGLIYPTVSLQSLSLWSCVSVGKSSYLIADLSIECDGASYTAASLVNIFLVLGFVVGWYV
jgi:hypothetical protein